MLTNRSRNINIAYTPLRVTSSVEVVGSVAGRQSYNAYTKEFIPDYSIVPLTIFPRVLATDPDKYTPSGTVNAKLTNMVWTDKTAGASKPISEGADFSIVVEGAQKGQITVKKNSSVLNPIALDFTADYVDARTQQVYKIHESFTIIVSDETGAMPVLNLDSPESMYWNPIREPKQQTITAKLISGSKDLTDEAGATFAFYRVLANGSLEKVGTDGDNDWEVVSLNRNVLVIDRDFIGDEQTYVCKAHFEKDGSTVEPNEKDVLKTTTIVRRLPHMECDWKGVSFGIPGGTSSIRPIAFVTDTVGTVPNPDEWIKFIWLVKKPGQGSFTKVAEGREPVIPMTDGMILDLQIEDKGAQAIVVDDNDPNIVMEDGGSILFQRINE